MTPSSQPNKKLRILLCSESYPPQINGISRRVQEYANGFRRCGHTVDLITPYNSGETWCLAHPWNGNAKLMLIRPLAFGRYVAEHQQYDVIHAVMPLNLSGGWILAMSKIFRSLNKQGNHKANNQSYPALVISHHLNGEQYINTYSPPVVRDFQKFLIFNCLSCVMPLLADRVVVPTLTTEPRLLRQWPDASKIGICHTGISPDFSPCALDSSSGQRWLVRKKEFLKKSRKQYLLLFSGRVAPEKGVHRLLAAMEHLEDCALWIVGDGPYRAQAEVVAREKGLVVDFLGYQHGDQLCSAYTVADCFVCPSHTETYGQVVQEAIASGIRVALPPTPQFLEAYESILGKNSFWILNDIRSMAETVQALVESPVQSLDQKLATRSQLLTWSDACEAMLTEYDDAMTASQENGTTLTFVGVLSVVLWMVGSWVIYISGLFVYFVAAFLWKIVCLPSFYVEEA